MTRAFSIDPLTDEHTGKIINVINDAVGKSGKSSAPSRNLN
jgi:hypothetical protein